MEEIIPTVFATSKKDFDYRFSKLVKIAKKIQIDIMDGNFVKRKSIELKDIPDLSKYPVGFEAHLMVKNPFDYIETCYKKGFEKILFHYESYWDLEKCKHLARLIHDKKMKAWIAINPETSISKIIPLYKEVDGVLLMGVHPGREHQVFAPRVYRKIRELRNRFPMLKIQVDGGVNSEDIGRLKKAGVNYFNSGSFISESDNPEKRMKELESLIRK